MAQEIVWSERVDGMALSLGRCRWAGLQFMASVRTKKAG